MGTIVICTGASLFIGYMVGWGKGYEQKEKDDKKIEGEMIDFWKEVAEHDHRNDSF